jgi:hypothetical protein
MAPMDGAALEGASVLSSGCGVGSSLNSFVMTEADQKREDDVLRRMLATKPKPHKAAKVSQPKPKK